MGSTPTSVLTNKGVYILDKEQLKLVGSTLAQSIHFSMNWVEPMNGDDIDEIVNAFREELDSLNGNEPEKTKHSLLLKEDFDKLKVVLDKLECDTLTQEGFEKLSGGFAHADMFDYDEIFFDVLLKYGVQSDVADTIHTEYYKVDRKTFQLLDM